jgi:hypothetical protein
MRYIKWKCTFLGFQKCARRSVKTQLIYCQLKWRNISTQGVIIKPIIEPCMRYIKWKCRFLGSQKTGRKFSQNTTNLFSVKVAKYFDSRSQHQANFWTTYKVHQVKVHIFEIPKMCTFTFCTSNMVQYLAWWWFLESKHVATLIFHFLYLKHGSIIGLMMIPWVETCRHFNWQ